MESRRNFLKKTGGFTAAMCSGLGLSALLQSCTTIKSVDVKYAQKKLSVLKTDLGEEGITILRNDRLSAGVYLIKQEESYGAYLMLCTHKDCELQPTGTFMTCPCHGSEFSNKGEVLAGPATEPLHQFKVTQDDTQVYVLLD